MGQLGSTYNPDNQIDLPDGSSISENQYRDVLMSNLLGKNGKGAQLNSGNIMVAIPTMAQINERRAKEADEIRGLVQRINQPLAPSSSGFLNKQVRAYKQRFIDKDISKAKVTLEQYLRRPENLRNFKGLPPKQQQGISSMLSEVHYNGNVGTR